MKTLITTIFLLFIGLTTSTKTSLENNQLSQSNFLGNWIYQDTSTNFQISIIKENTIYKGRYSLLVNNGSQIDIPFDNNSYNMTIGNYNATTKSLNIILNSSYSNAKYNAVLRLIDDTTIEFSLGSAIIKDIMFYPSKTIRLSRIN